MKWLTINIFFVDIKRSPENPTSPPVDENGLQAVFTKSVYNYATVIYSKSEDSHPNKLDHDIQKILGSSDPPPGFGFLHPKVYYLTQNRPIPLEPLRVCISILFFIFLFSLMLSQWILVDRVDKKK